MDISLYKNSLNGIEIIKIISKNKNIPCIYLTASIDTNIIQQAISTKPVGYLIKPFSEKELIANIMLGIYKAYSKDNIISNKFLKLYDYYTYDTINNLLYYKKKLIKLSKKEIKFLEFLIHAKGELVLSEIILNHIWENNYVTKSSLKILVHRIRAKLNYELIESVPYYGYKILMK